jgi:glycosyltransferase involved in cell wall biosynthesis
LSDLDLRTLYQGSRFVVTPLKDSTQPQGQSVTLQAMACGKAVILSQTRGLWSRPLMRHLDNCYLVQHSDVHALRAAIDHLEREPALCARIGEEARRSVERHFSSDLMGARIGTILQEVCEPVRQAC